jgi:hypothetical protein
MAMPGQPPVQGGLGAMAPAKPAPAGNPPSESQDAARVSAMEQDTILSPDEVARKALLDRKQQSQALENQIKLLTQSLDSRMNPGYDVPLMQMAAGFLKPTKTGSFGESLGYGMENYSKASDEDFVRKQAVDKQRLEYLQKLADIQGQRGITDFQLAELGSPKGTTVRTGAEPTPMGANTSPVSGGAPDLSEIRAGASAALTAAPTAPAAEPSAMPSVAGSSRPMTIDRVKQAYAIDPSGKLGKQFEEQLKMEQEAIKIQRGQVISTPDGMFNVDTKQYMPLDPYLDKPIEMPVPYVGNQKITQRMAKEIEDLDKKYPTSGPAREDAFAQYYARRGVGEVTYQPPVAGKPAVVGGMKTPGQQQLEKEGSSETQKLDIQENAALKKGLFEAGRGAYGQILSADALYKLATDPKTKGAFGVLQDNTVQSAILGALADGIQTPSGSIKFAGIEDAVRKIGGTDAEINAALQAARYYAELELNYARTYLKGQGAVSDNERKIVGKIGGSLSDTPQVAAAKAETIKARANYDKQVSDFYYQWEKKNPGKMVKDFERDPEFTRLQGHFDDFMGKLNDKYFPGSKPAAPAGNAPAQNTPATKPAGNAPAAPPVVSGDNDPAYIALKPGQQYIYNGVVKTKK